ncbi:hypothetical protein GGI12_001973 [Dipsacomyces acuminosporus]|nr:hypothetical protein GGI12_001973 [Dipsacomyces acuminosporus]
MSKKSSDDYDKSIHRLLGEIQGRKRQAMQLVNIIEQSMYIAEPNTPGTPNTLDTQDTRPMELLSESPSSASPPNSFFEGFTRDFIDNYQPQGTDQLVGATERNQIRRILKSRATRGVGSHRNSYYDEQPHLQQQQQQQQQQRHSVRMNEVTDTFRDISLSQQPIDTCSGSASLLSNERAHEHKTAASSTTSTADVVDGVTKIDRSARDRLWSRVNAVRPSTENRNEEDDDEWEESRIRAIVNFAERIIDVQSPSPCEDKDTGLADVEKQDTEEDPGCTKAASSTKPQKTDGREGNVSEEILSTCCWIDGEWAEWSRFISHEDGAGTSSSIENMARRLEWVHERQLDLWRYGFHDVVLPNGKLQRAYEIPGLVLEAYPDGNVKRTASRANAPALPSSKAQASACKATTLYFANGDWLCTTLEGDEMVKTEYYYYSHENVWHVQTLDGSEYRYPDGRVERVNTLQGTHIITLPSGETQVSLTR